MRSNRIIIGVTAALCGLAVNPAGFAANVAGAQEVQPSPAPYDSAAGDRATVAPGTRAPHTLRTPILGYTMDAGAVERWRLQQVLGASTDGFLLRSTSSVLGADASSGALVVLRPVSQTVFNSAIPSAANDGPLWAGQGFNNITTFGARVRAGPFRVVLAPQFVVSENGVWDVRDTTLWWSPDPAPGRVGRAYTLSWYQGRFSIDLPLRFGSGARAFLDPGQTSVYAVGGPVELGASTENNWWGPGVRNALVLSNSAPGFLHLFLRSSYPWRTVAGNIEWRWLAGALEESDYFDEDPENDTRSISAFAITLRPRFAANLTVGATRSVMSNSSGTGDALGSWFDVLRRTGRSEPAQPWDAPAPAGGREHIIGLFGRYVMPNPGAEFYAEWGRTALSSMRDVFVAPNHTQGYTLGMLWTRGMRARDSRFQVQAEVTNVEQSATFRDRPTGTWYTSRNVVQGYTHRGEMLGAAIGPGASAQWLATDYFATRGSVGVYLGRTRWNEDIRSTVDWPEYMRYCNHDVTTYAGVRGSRIGRWGTAAADLTIGNRINSFFRVASCSPPGRRDVRNTTLRLTLAPAP